VYLHSQQVLSFLSLLFILYCFLILSFIIFIKSIHLLTTVYLHSQQVLNHPGPCAREEVRLGSAEIPGEGTLDPLDGKVPGGLRSSVPGGLGSSVPGGSRGTRGVETPPERCSGLTCRPSRVEVEDPSGASCFASLAVGDLSGLVLGVSVAGVVFALTLLPAPPASLVTMSDCWRFRNKKSAWKLYIILAIPSRCRSRIAGAQLRGSIPRAAKFLLTFSRMVTAFFLPCDSRRVSDLRFLIPRPGLLRLIIN